MSKLWVLIHNISNMPLQVERSEFRPSVGAFESTWKRVYLDDELNELERLEAQIKAHQDAMRPLLDKWEELRRK
jgi:hypothetical protein